MNPRYSVCITHFNQGPTIERSLRSVLDQIDGEFEVVVVDQTSTDGSLEVLERFAKEGSIRLYHQTVRNRGLGRQLAFEMSKGETIVAQIDMDDVYQPVLRDLLVTYETHLRGRTLRAVNDQKRGAVTIAPRSFLSEIGGWVDLNYVEDRWIWGRAAEQGLYSWARFPLYSKITESREKRNYLDRTARVYGILRDRMRIGAMAHPSRYNWPMVPFAYVSAKKAKPIRRPVFKRFWPDDPKYCADNVIHPN